MTNDNREMDLNEAIERAFSHVPKRKVTVLLDGVPTEMEVPDFRAMIKDGNPKGRSH